MDLPLPLIIAVEPDVVTIFLFTGQLKSTTLLERNSNDSCLLVGSNKKSAHFKGSLFLPATFLQTPFPCFSLVDSLMLLGIYMSHTTLTRVQLSS